MTTGEGIRAAARLTEDPQYVEDAHDVANRVADQLEQDGRLDISTWEEPARDRARRMAAMWSELAGQRPPETDAGVQRVLLAFEALLQYKKAEARMAEARDRAFGLVQ